MSAVAWTFLVLVVLALAAASVWRRLSPPAPPPRPGGALPRADDLGTLGLTPARPVGASSVRPATPSAVPSAVAAGSTAATPDAWTEDDEPGWTYDTGTATPAADTPAAPRSVRDETTAETTTEATVETLETETAVDETVSDEAVADAPAGPADTPRLARPSPLTSPAAPSFVAPDSPLWVAPGPPEHLLASLAACTGGTVAVLRRAADGYHVDALAGLPTGAPPAVLAADGPHPLDRAPLDRVLSILDGDDLAALAYLPGGSARSALVRALDETPEPRVLVAVTLGVDADHVDADTARLIGDYVNLLAALRADASLPDDGAADASADDPDDAPNDEVADEPADVETDKAHPAAGAPTPDSPATAAPARAPETLPRSVILAGEIAAARAARRPLAFALVTRADADALMADDGRAESAEADLVATLRAAPRVRRVEPFDRLVLGVFLDAESDQVPTWATSLGGPAVRVGAVAPAAGDPEAIRRAAARALERAYAQGVVCLLAD